MCIQLAPREIRRDIKQKNMILRVLRIFLTVQNQMALTGTIPNICIYKAILLFFFFLSCLTTIVGIISYDLIPVGAIFRTYVLWQRLVTV
jgi:hypothetical protein